MRLALWDLSNVILKLGFRRRRAFDGTLLVIQKNTVACTLIIAMYLLSFFRGNLKSVFIKFMLKCTILFLNKYGMGPDKHIYQLLLLFLVEAKI